MSKLKALLVAVSIVPFVMNAQNLVKNGDAEASLENWDKSQVKVVSEKTHSGKNCFKTLCPDIQSSELIPVDTSKKYKLSGWFKSPDDKSCDLFFGLIPFDADKNQIQDKYVNAVGGSDTELAEACKEGDSVITVKDASKWVVSDKFNYVSFDTDNSGAYKDIPNSKLTSSIVKTEQNGNVWKVTLEKPCGHAYPANTPIRLQRSGSTYMYLVISRNLSSPEWKEYSAEVKGEAKTGTPAKQFWTKTKYAKVVVRALDGGMICFDDLSFEPVEEANTKAQNTQTK